MTGSSTGRPSPVGPQRTRSSRQKLWGWARDGALLLLIYAGVQVFQTRNAAAGVAPEISAVSTHGGGPVQLSSYRGKPVMLHFWATWCGVCKAEQDNVQALSRDVPVLTVASRSGGAAEVARYLSEQGLKVEALLDPQGLLASRFGVGAYPTTFFLDREGRVRHVTVGYTTALGMRARMWLAGL